ncbi:MAG: MBL fold metallo-hydrolase [Chloroflexi bacterium]|nr:MBL fold metallo-hydrolase [Chloroflexota bacterium]
MERRRAINLLLVVAMIVAMAGVLKFGLADRLTPVGRAANGTQIEAPTLEWLGWSHFRVTTSTGKVILFNPFITGNADASVKLEDITKADIILVPNGHRDEQGDAVAIAQKTGAKLVAGGFELGSWFIQKGVPPAQVVRSNPGNWHDFGGIIVRVVNSVHGSGLPEPTIENPYGGPAAGFFVTLENGYTIYHAGSTAATMDMQLWGAMFKPDLAILPLNGDRDPLDVGQMVKLLLTNNPNLTRVIPHHQRVEPPAGATTIAQMESAIRSVAGSGVSVLRLQRGQALPLMKGNGFSVPGL